MAEEDTVQTVAAEVCQFPGGCTNVLPPKSGRRGAPRLYCGLPVDGRVHNPQNALAVQRRRDEEDSAVMRRGGLAVDTPDQARAVAPVDLARAKTGVLVEQLGGQLAAQAAVIEAALGQLAILADPAAAEAQLSATSTAAQAEVAQARAGQAVAEQQARAEIARAEA